MGHSEDLLIVEKHAQLAHTSLDRERADSLSMVANHSSGCWFLTGVLNPKAIMFYMALLAQLIDPDTPQIRQFLILILMATSAVIVEVGSRTPKDGLRRGACLLGGSTVMAIT